MSGNKDTGFIDVPKLEALVAALREDPEAIRAVLAKSRRLEALDEAETAVLLAAESPELLEEIFATARELKKRVYGNRIVLFAPLYVGNYCVNDCKYCGFRRSLTSAVRHTLSEAELTAEVRQLEKAGHKRLILVFGEHADYSPEFIAAAARRCYATRVGNGEIRRVNINAAPLDVEGFRTVKAAGIGTYQIFQETYHPRAYAEYHPAGTRKSDYLWRLTAMDRAFAGGCDDVGLGVLFGLADWRFEILALISHARHLQQTCGVGPHTISFPRLQPAHGVDRTAFKHLVGDADFKKLVAILRLAVPYTGLIMTARESAAIRDEVIEFGVSQIDAGTRLEIGGYQEKNKTGQELNREQFQVGDCRRLDEAIGWLIGRGFLPSFCTSCYRLGRTGEHFMEYAIPGFIGRFCTPNAILTLAEYLEDYSGEETRRAGYALIETEIAALKDEKLKAKLIERLEKIKSGQRDLYF